MERAGAVALFVLLPVALAGYGMWIGWRHRRQRDVGRFAPLPAEIPPGRPPDAHLRYTGTTLAGRWLERVALPGLFGRGDAEVWVEPRGLVFQRTNAPVVAAAPVVTVSLERGHAGQTVGHGRVLVVRWEHLTAEGEPVAFDSGFVCASVDQARALADRVRPAEAAA